MTTHPLRRNAPNLAIMPARENVRDDFDDSDLLAEMESGIRLIRSWPVSREAGACACGCARTKGEALRLD